MLRIQPRRREADLCLLKFIYSTVLTDFNPPFPKNLFFLTDFFTSNAHIPVKR